MGRKGGLPTGLLRVDRYLASKPRFSGWKCGFPRKNNIPEQGRSETCPYVTLRPLVIPAFAGIHVASHK